MVFAKLLQSCNSFYFLQNDLCIKELIDVHRFRCQGVPFEHLKIVSEDYRLMVWINANVLHTLSVAAFSLRNISVLISCHVLINLGRRSLKSCQNFHVGLFHRWTIHTLMPHVKTCPLVSITLLFYGLTCSKWFMKLICRHLCFGLILLLWHCWWFFTCC